MNTDEMEDLNRTCIVCGKAFKKRYGRQITCSVKCSKVRRLQKQSENRSCSAQSTRTDVYKYSVVCEHCNNIFYLDKARFNYQRARFCSRSCAGKSRTKEKSNNWKGGTFVKKGYVMVRTTNANGKQAYVYQHRLIAEKILDRKLLPTEVIHHINENPADNRPENLYLFSSTVEHLLFHGKVYREEIDANLQSNLCSHHKKELSKS